MHDHQPESALVIPLHHEHPFLQEGATHEREGAFVSLATAIHLYLRARRAEFAPNSRRHIRHTLGEIVRIIGPDMLVRNLRRRHVESWLADLEVAPATIRNRLSALRVFCRWCIISGHLKQDPTLGLRGPRQPDAMPRELTDDDIVSLFSVLPDERAEVMAMLGLVQGLRVGSMAAQLREDIDLTGRMMLVTRTKGNRQLWLPLLPDTYEAIVNYYRKVPGTTGPLLRSLRYPSRGVTSGHLSILMSHWMSDAGIKLTARDGKSSHALRHTRAGTMLDDGADIRAVQAALGHASLSSTYIYLRRRQADSALRDAMGRRRYRDAS